MKKENSHSQDVWFNQNCREVKSVHPDILENGKRK